MAPNQSKPDSSKNKKGKKRKNEEESDLTTRLWKGLGGLELQRMLTNGELHQHEKEKKRRQAFGRDWGIRHFFENHIRQQTGQERLPTNMEVDKAILRVNLELEEYDEIEQIMKHMILVMDQINDGWCHYILEQSCKGPDKHNNNNNNNNNEGDPSTGGSSGGGIVA